MVSTTKELSATITTLFIDINLLMRWAGRAPSPWPDALDQRRGRAVSSLPFGLP
jgi:hypothetical protein